MDVVGAWVLLSGSVIGDTLIKGTRQFFPDSMVYPVGTVEGRLSPVDRSLQNHGCDMFKPNMSQRPNAWYGRLRFHAFTAHSK
jgi:hypothetical protein